MDAREREDFQSRRLSIKRPWDDDTAILPTHSIEWQGSVLPPIDTVPYRRHSLQFAAAPIPASHRSQIIPSSIESVAKRSRGNDYTSSLNLQQRTLKAASLNGVERRPRGETQDACRRLTMILPCSLESTAHALQPPDPSFAADCKRDSDLAYVTDAAAAGLVRLAETLSLGFPPERRDVIREDFSLVDCPPIAELGLKSTLNWILGRISLVNELADELVQHAPRFPRQIIPDSPLNGAPSQNGFDDIMKRRIDAEQDDAFRSRGDASDPILESKPYLRRKSIATMMPGTEELPPMMSQLEHHSLLASSDGLRRRASFMNPPPAPNRQLPSPPGRSLPSPTSISFPSPSGPSYGSASQPPHVPPSSSHHQSPLSNSYLPPIASAHSNDPAIQAHSAALQHEVSVQKIALSSLQNEHDKLLAAFSRSQTRASALEKKHAVSDSEIISLTEEKLRLHAQIIELERDVEELSRSRDESRRAAVQEGAQYVEIVKKATRLEEITSDERKSWNRLKKEMETRIISLTSSIESQHGITSVGNTTVILGLTDGDNSLASPVDMLGDSKVEPAVEPSVESRSVGSTSDSTIRSPDATEHLKAEIRRLQDRCEEVETALRVVRDESSSMEGIVRALGLTGKSIMERADRALGNMTS